MHLMRLSKKNKKRIFDKGLKILLISDSIVLFAGAMFGPIYALFVKKIGGNLLAASLTGGTFSLVAGITSLIAGKFADIFKKYDVLIVAVGYFIIGFGFLLYMFVDSINLLLLVQAIIGFAEAFHYPAFDALYSKHIVYENAGTEWGAWESMYHFSNGLGAVVGGVIITLFGFNTAFMVMFTLCILSGCFLILNKNNL